MSLRFLALDLLKKIHQFDSDDSWQIINSCLEFISEDANEAVDDIIKMLFKNKKDKDSEEEEEELKTERLGSLDILLPKKKWRPSKVSINEALSYSKNRDKKKKIIEIIFQDLELQTEGKKDIVQEKINELSRYFNLKETERKFLVLVYHETLNSRTSLGGLVRDGLDITEIYTECSSVEANNLCSRSSENPLVLKGLMKFGHRNSTILSEMVQDFIHKDAPLNLTELFLDKESFENILPLESFKQPEERKNTLVRILKNSPNAKILLFGQEGTGKTEFAKTICRNLGVNCYFLRPFNEKGSDSLGQRRMGLFMAPHILGATDSVLIVDEADKLLATERAGGFFSLFMENVNDDEKAWMNQFLDQSNIRIIFIINKKSLDRSTLRRFSIMMEFESLSVEQTTDMVSKILIQKELTNVDKTEIISFIEDNPGLNIGSYALAAETASKDENVELKRETFFEVLKSHHEILGKSHSKRTLSKDFDQSLLNLSTPPEKIIEAVKRIREGKSFSKNLPMLFYGLQGTGKTEFAHQIAKRFGMTLDVYGGSDLLDPYLGQTEKNIAKAFKNNSSNKNKIIFIDEADSLFKSRASAEKSWMISQTNELLRQMENYQGIFIAATNFNSLLDEAAMRRFHLKVEFRSLNPEKLKELYLLKFTCMAGDLSLVDLKNLQSISHLTPGDLHAVWSRICYEDKISHKEIISELRKENSFKQKIKRITLE
jgi:SpoVK/Ycf46/Vps4 family AAA+-type ATPase